MTDLTEGRSKPCHLDKDDRARRGRGDKKAGDKEKGQRRTLFRRRKVCKFCADKIDDINYKDVKLLGPFVPERGKILPRRISGTCAMHQRKLQIGDQARASDRADPVRDGLNRVIAVIGESDTRLRTGGQSPDQLPNYQIINYQILRTT